MVIGCRSLSLSQLIIYIDMVLSCGSLNEGVILWVLVSLRCWNVADLIQISCLRRFALRAVSVCVEIWSVRGLFRLVMVYGNVTCSTSLSQCLISRHYCLIISYTLVIDDCACIVYWLLPFISWYLLIRFEFKFFAYHFTNALSKCAFWSSLQSLTPLAVILVDWQAIK